MRSLYDYYPTPSGLVYRGLSTIVPDTVTPSVLDPGAGAGVWGMCARLLWPSAHITGVECRPVSPHNQYDRWVTANFLECDFETRYNVVCMNPPFSACEEFLVRGLELLTKDGVLIMLGRLALLEGQARYKSLWSNYPPTHVSVLTKRPSFTGKGTDATAYALFYWERSNNTNRITTVGWM